MTIRNVVVADWLPGHGKTWIVRWDGGDSTAMTEEEADQLAAGVSQVAALRAELDLYRDAEKDLKGATIAKQFRDERDSLRAELETTKRDLDDLRKSEAALDGHCNAHVAERDSLRAELETANRKLENAIVLCEGDRKRHTAEHAAQVRQAEELRAEARAVAIEEAKRILVWNNTGRGCSCVVGEDTCWHGDVNDVASLAPLDPALCVVATEAKQAAIDAIKRLLAQVEGRTSDDSIPFSTPAEDGIAALSLLGAGRSRSVECYACYAETGVPVERSR